MHCELRLQKRVCAARATSLCRETIAGEYGPYLRLEMHILGLYSFVGQVFWVDELAGVFLYGMSDMGGFVAGSLGW